MRTAPACGVMYEAKGNKWDACFFRVTHLPRVQRHCDIAMTNIYKSFLDFAWATQTLSLCMLVSYQISVVFLFIFF